MNDKDWQEEDKNYSPKRKVNNRASKTIHHIIGSFYSNKMNRVIEYESLSELIFYNLLELDKSIKRYYVQPVEIPIDYIDEKGQKKSWIHIPDVLVYRSRCAPSLYQIKSEVIKPDNNKLNIINKACERYSYQNNWKYSIVYPKNLPEIIIRNIKFLGTFIEERKEYCDVIDDLIFTVKTNKEITILELAKSFETRINPLQVFPVIYYLVAKGILFTDIRVEVNQFSLISMNKDNNIFFNDFYLAGENH